MSSQQEAMVAALESQRTLSEVRTLFQSILLYRNLLYSTAVLAYGARALG